MAIDKAVILARVSSKGQEEEGYSLESQVKLLTAYSKDKNLRIAETYKIAETASKATQRKIFKKAMAFIEKKRYKALGH